MSKSDYNKAYYEANKERLKEAARKHYYANKERHAETKKAWHEKNHDRVLKLQREWYRRNRDRVAARGKLKQAEVRLAKHGLTREAYEEILAKQGEVCAICSLKCEVAKVLSIDHCHETGRVRGLLCKRCNSGLGFFRDSVEMLRSAVAYLEMA